MNFKPLEAYLDQLVNLGIPGCTMRIWKDHEQIYAHSSGEAEHGRPMRGDETYWMYSATKIVTATAVMQLVEKGLLHLDDPVCNYLPAYRHLTVRDGKNVRPASTVMTIRHLLTMCGGLNYDCESQAFRDCVARCGSAASTIRVVEALATQPLDFDPGTHFQYSLCHDVLAAVIEKATGVRFSEYVNQCIIRRLGISDMTFHPTEAQLQRLAARYYWDRENHPVEMERRSLKFRFSSEYESGGAGLLSDADGYILFADALANGGIGKNGERILQQETIDLMRSDQLNAVTGRDFANRFIRPGYSYGLGVRTLVDETKSKSPRGEFGWDGAAGAWVMIDPKNHLAALYIQHVLDCETVYLKYHPHIRDLVYEGLFS